MRGCFEGESIPADVAIGDQVTLEYTHRQETRQLQGDVVNLQESDSRQRAYRSVTIDANCSHTYRLEFGGAVSVIESQHETIVGHLGWIHNDE